LQSEAAGGEIVAAASTVLAAVCDAESIGKRQVKGREEPVEVFRVRAG
jgi:class 3 adenylate cyclase